MVKVFPREKQRIDIVKITRENPQNYRHIIFYSIENKI